jgi:DNA polymerase
VVLAVPGDFAEWRRVARGLLASGVAPEDVSWRGAEEGASLFGDEVAMDAAGAVSLPRGLLAMADRVICHRGAEVPARLYRLVWRAARERQLLARTTDADVDWLR